MGKMSNIREEQSILDDLAKPDNRKKLKELLKQVDENIQNPYTKPTNKRILTIKITFQPGEDRESSLRTFDFDFKPARLAGEPVAVLNGNHTGLPFKEKEGEKPITGIPKKKVAKTKKRD